MMLMGAVSTLVIGLLMAATLSLLLLTGRVWRRRRPPRQPGPDADDALRRHPAGRARRGGPEGWTGDGTPYPGSVIGPDDDPDFISALDWLIHGDDPDTEA
jgi:hypothetical protein